MGTLELVLGIIMLVVAVGISVLILLQSGKDKRLSGSIAGAAETFFGKTKSADTDKKLTIITAIVAGLFAVLTLALYCITNLPNA